MTDAIQREEEEARAAARRDYQKGNTVQLQIPDFDRKLDLFIDREIDHEI
jgi:hypothetical protein